MLKVLHVVKTSDGAKWAAYLIKSLVKLGIQVHVVLPSKSGTLIDYWSKTGAILHFADFRLPIGSPTKFAKHVKAIRELVYQIKPDLIHSHFVTTTLMLRLALGRNHTIPRIFHVPGPLHLEYSLYRNFEILTSGISDYWIASSLYTRNLYLKIGMPSERVFLSYYGLDFEEISSINSNSEEIIKNLNIPQNCILIGNISYMYPPKYFLGHFKGIKRHEDIIKAISIVSKERNDVYTVLVGGQWGKFHWYENKLKKIALKKAPGKIKFTGHIKHSEVIGILPKFNLVIHVPISENCGGVVEPLFFGIPTIASNVGGLPEVVIDGKTGWLVPPRNYKILAQTILEVLNNYDEALRRSYLGSQLVQTMFDVNRTAKEVIAIYEHICNPNKPIPKEFDSNHFLQQIQNFQNNSLIK